MVDDGTDSVNLKIRLHPMYIRRLFATKAFILKIEIDKDDIDFKRDIKRPQLKFQWKFSPNLIMDDATGKEYLSCIGEHCESTSNMFTDKVDELDHSMFNLKSAAVDNEQ